MAMTRIKIDALACECNVCHNRWISTAARQPDLCASRKCRSREWNGKSRRSRAKEVRLPAPPKIGRPKSKTLIDNDE